MSNTRIAAPAFRWERSQLNHAPAYRASCPEGTQLNLEYSYDQLKMQGLMAKSRRVLFGEWLSPSHCDSPQICKSVDPQCPLMEGQWHTYSTTINTHKSYSRMTVPLQWLLMDSNGNLMVCVEIQVEIV
ncbi:hypothetical protein CRM22_006756 [Opisthorchis felineus]|uniref:MD-2-related lipid-recognition domain-containing protein n=1 Tax=Opisthorchis felineus TaxID=147828 RepID=A0A4S2LJD8_OPIFE|nr:hypothetical protein CRM22_006756 [Opisthorchis felineus]